MMARPPKDPTMGLNMPFSEALERYSAVSPDDVAANVARSKKKKPPGGKKSKRKPSGKKSAKTNVISLKDRKTSLRRRGLTVR